MIHTIKGLGKVKCADTDGRTFVNKLFIIVVYNIAVGLR